MEHDQLFEASFALRILNPHSGLISPTRPTDKETSQKAKGLA